MSLPELDTALATCMAMLSPIHVLHYDVLVFHVVAQTGRGVDLSAVQLIETSTVSADRISYTSFEPTPRKTAICAGLAITILTQRTHFPNIMHKFCPWKRPRSPKNASLSSYQE